MQEEGLRSEKDAQEGEREVRYIDVHGREEHEALLMNTKKMIELGLDPYFELIKYLKRWGGFLDAR